MGVASYKLLRALEVDVDYPLEQTSCGQPQSNGGFEEMAVSHAEHFEQIFKDYDYIIGPSASCAVFVRINYPELGYGCFIRGPSKTADIDQALVMGAQAAIEATVVMI